MKLERKQSKEEQVRFILEDRLKLQSTQRYLDEIKVPGRKFEYFISRDFKKNYFTKWDAFKKRVFLEKLVGDRNWKKFQEMLEKE